MNKEKIRELSKHLTKNWQKALEFEDLITDWLEQNQPEPVVVGLSDDEIYDLSYRLARVGVNGGKFGDDVYIADKVIKPFLKTIRFTQPEVKEVPVGLTKEQIEQVSAAVQSGDYSSQKTIKNKIKTYLKSQKFAQPCICGIDFDGEYKRLHQDFLSVCAERDRLQKELQLDWDNTPAPAFSTSICKTGVPIDGATKLLHELKHTDSTQPVVGQVWHGNSKVEIVGIDTVVRYKHENHICCIEEGIEDFLAKFERMS